MKKSAKTPDGRYEVIINDDNSVTINDRGSKVSVVKPVLREICESVSMEYEPSWNTRHLGSCVVDYLATLDGTNAPSGADCESSATPSGMQKVRIEVRENRGSLFKVVSSETSQVVDLSEPFMMVYNGGNGFSLYVNGKEVEDYFKSKSPDYGWSSHACCESKYSESDSPTYEVYELFYAGAVATVDIDVDINDFNINKLRLTTGEIICGKGDGSNQQTCIIGRYLSTLKYDDDEYGIHPKVVGECQADELVGVVSLECEDIINRIEEYRFDYDDDELTDIYEDETPAHDYKYVKCHENILSIGDRAFEDSPILRIYEIDQLQSIGNRAFYNSNLKYIALGNELKTIGEKAFYNTKLERLIIPDSVKSMSGAIGANHNLRVLVVGKSVKDFTCNLIDCDSLQKITFRGAEPPMMDDDMFDHNADIKVYVPQESFEAYKKVPALQKIEVIGVDIEDPLYICREAIYEGKPYREAVVLDGVKEVLPHLFDANTGLLRVTLPESVTAIGEQAFNKCSELRRIVMSSNLERIGRFAFQACEALDKVIVPECVTVIEDGAFNGCKSLKSIVIPESVKVIQSKAFANCCSLKEVIIKGKPEIADDAFEGCPATVAPGGADCESSATPSGKPKVHIEVRERRGRSIKVVSSDTSQEVGGTGPIIRTYYDAYALRLYVNGKEVDNFFPRKLGNPKNYPRATKDYYVGQDCDSSMYEVYELFYVGAVATVDIDVDVDDFDVAKLGVGLSDGNIICGEDGACYRFGLHVTSLSYDGVKYELHPEVGECQAELLLDVVGPGEDNREHINEKKEYQFVDWNGKLTGIYKDGNSARDKLYVAGCAKIKTIGDRAFENCPIVGIYNIDNVESIGNRAFYDSNLKFIDLGNELKTIGEQAFHNTKLERLVIPDSVETMSGALEANENLREVVVGKSVKDFTCNLIDCDSLQKITFRGAEPPMMDDDMFDHNADVEIYVPQESLEAYSKVATLKNHKLVGIGVGAPEDAYESFFEEPIREAVVLDGVTEVAPHIFETTERMWKVTLPDSVTAIGDYAFDECFDMKEIVMSNNLERIGERAFQVCYALRKVVVPASVRVIDEGAFSMCDVLKEVVIENGVTVLGDSMFSSCAIKEIDIPGSVEKIGSGAFFRNEALKAVTLHEGLQEIGSGAFNGCESLESIVIPASVKVIQSKAFANCSSLKEVTIKGEPEIADDAFVGCPATVAPCGANCENSATPSGKQMVHIEVRENRGSIYKVVSSETSQEVGRTHPFMRVYNQGEGFSLYVNGKEVEGFFKSNAPEWDWCFNNFYVGEDSESDNPTYEMYELFYAGAVATVDIDMDINDFDINKLKFISSNGRTIYGESDDSEQPSSHIGRYLWGLGYGDTEYEIRPEVVGECQAELLLDVVGAEEDVINENNEYEFVDWDDELTGIYEEDNPAQDYRFVSGCDEIKTIGDRAFEDCPIVSIYNIDNVESIGYAAFYDSNLKYISLGNQLKTIGEQAFHFTNLERLVIPDSVETMSGALEANHDLRRVVVGKSVKDFTCNLIDCESLCKITFRGAEPPMMDDDMFDYNADVKVYVPQESLEAYKQVPALQKVEVIGIDIDDPSYACREAIYEGKPYREAVVLDGVKEVPSHLFATIENLLKVTLPDSVTVIGEQAFGECSRMKRIVMSSNVERIGRFAFRACEALDKVVLPEGVTVIDEGAFDGCKSLESIVIPASVKNIKSKAFANCSSLKEVTIKGKPEIAEDAFEGCPAKIK